MSYEICRVKDTGNGMYRTTCKKLQCQLLFKWPTFRASLRGIDLSTSNYPLNYNGRILHSNTLSRHCWLFSRLLLCPLLHCRRIVQFISHIFSLCASTLRVAKTQNTQSLNAFYSNIRYTLLLLVFTLACTSIIHTFYHFVSGANTSSHQSSGNEMIQQLQQASRIPVRQVDRIRLKFKHQYVDQFRDRDVCEFSLCHGAAYGHHAIVRTEIKLIDSRTRRRLLPTVIHRQPVVSQHHPLPLPYRLTSPATHTILEINICALLCSPYALAKGSVAGLSVDICARLSERHRR